MMSVFRSADPLGPRMDPWHPVSESMWVQNGKRRVLVANPAADVNFDQFVTARVSGFGVQEIHEGWRHGFRHTPARTIGASGDRILATASFLNR